jgi:transposase
MGCRGDLRASHPTVDAIVTVKSQAQQDILALHRIRALLILERTGLMNQVRGLLAERGIVVAKGVAQLGRALAELLGDHDEHVSELIREALAEMSERQVY